MYASIHPDPEAPAKVPIFLDGDTHLIESIVVVEYLAQKYRNQGTDLLPTDPADTARAKLFIEIWTNYVTSALFGLYRADSTEAVDTGRAKLTAGLRMVEECLRRHGHEDGGSYFLGSNFTIADVATVPFLQRLVVTLKAYRDIDVGGIIRDEKLARLQRWMDAVLERPSALSTKPSDDVIVSSMRKFVVDIK